MKKFIMTCPIQGKKPNGDYALTKQIYEAVENEKLQMNKETRFPIIALLNAYVERGEKVELITFRHDYENSKMNYGLLCEEVKELEQKKEITCDMIPIDIPYSEEVEEHLNNFGHLIEYMKDGDELYACMTYGTKAIPIVQMMALNFAYRTRKNTHIGCIAYGQMDFNTKKAKIYDMTALFYMDEVVRKVAETNTDRPLEMIKKILKL